MQVVAFESHENGRKFLMEGEINVENMKVGNHVFPYPI